MAHGNKGVYFNNTKFIINIMDTDSENKQLEARQYMTGLIEKHFPSGILPDPYKGRDIYTMGGRELEGLYKDIFHVETEQWIFEKE